MKVRGVTVAVTVAASMIVACVGPEDDEAGSLSDAVVAGNVARAQAFIEEGADVDQPGALGLTPLIQAANREDVEMVHLLLDAGAALNATGLAGMTALHVAVRADSAEVVSALLERGADPKGRSRDGMDAVAHAADSGAVTVIDLFADLGLDLDAPSGVTSGGHGHLVTLAPLPSGLLSAPARSKQWSYFSNAGRMSMVDLRRAPLHCFRRSITALHPSSCSVFWMQGRIWRSGNDVTLVVPARFPAPRA